MGAAVSVTVTFLFTDIEGSSRMWELDPAAMDGALHSHNDVVSQIVHAHRGTIFKTMGDACCCAFVDPADATRAAIAAQIALNRQGWPASTGPLRVRMGLHTGSAICDDGDYFGPPLNRVARIMSSAHGGQIVASLATFALLDAGHDDFAFTDLGVKRLKDLERPERLYQVIANGLNAQFPPLRTLDEYPNNLPTQLSSFVGRRAELTRVGAALEASRVVTIVGSGGVGKTRLALQFASESAHRFPAGAFFVELAAITDPVLVPHAMAATLGLTESGSEDPLQTIARFVGDRSMLLIVDNSEHLLGEVAMLVKLLASTCSNISILVTSREPLHLAGERVERLAPMSLPDRVDASELENVDGCKLFLERARAAGADFASLRTEAAGVVAICRRLEGIPLAIEIAASRAAIMAPNRLARRLEAHLLVNKDPTVSERHRTLAKAIEWSYRLLNEREKRAFVAMAVFRGSCTAEALSAVADFDAEDELESLQDKSLVYEVDGSGDESRFRFSDPTREFATSELPPSSPSWERHRDFFLCIVRNDDDQSEKHYRAISDDMDNIRAAIEWCLANDSASASAFALALVGYWRAHASFAEGRLWIGRARSKEQAPIARADLTRYAASFAVMQDDYVDADTLAREALRSYQAMANTVGEGAALHILAEVAHRRGKLDDADLLYSKAFERLVSADHTLGIVTCLKNRGLLARQRGNFARAEELLSDAERRAGQLDSSPVERQLVIERGWLALCENRAQDARLLFQRALEMKTVQTDAYGLCQARLGLATLTLLDEDFHDALSSFKEALREAHGLGAQMLKADALFGIAAAHAKLGRSRKAGFYRCLAERWSAQLQVVSRPDFARAIAIDGVASDVTDKMLELTSRIWQDDPGVFISNSDALPDD